MTTTKAPPQEIYLYDGKLITHKLLPSDRNLYSKTHYMFVENSRGWYYRKDDSLVFLSPQEAIEDYIARTAKLIEIAEARLAIINKASGMNTEYTYKDYLQKWQDKHGDEITCGACGVADCQYHKPGCDMERCPFCNGQLKSCPCSYIQLGYDYDPYHETCGLPLEVYNEGLPDKDVEKWEDILKKRGLVPFILWPLMCAKCGELWPDLFMVPDEEWQKYIQADMRGSIVCRSCFSKIKSVQTEQRSGPPNE